jgi:ketosteroid isomerase-like protein
MSLTPHDFDPLAVVVDWLDACRSRDLNAVLELYDETRNS